ncbi:unnamed protein product, partial [Allacma fusca]
MQIVQMIVGVIVNVYALDAKLG